MDSIEETNYQTFRDCLATVLIQKSTEQSPKNKSRRNRKGNVQKATVLKSQIDKATERRPNDDAEELADFIDYLATEIFSALPITLQTLTYSLWLNSSSLHASYPAELPNPAAHRILDTLPPSITDSLTAYSILPHLTTLSEFLTPVLISYLCILTTAPPPAHEARALATQCEICDRGWIPLTYHHLVPRAVHAKALKRGWHTEDHLNDAAWLCRACHSFVHSVASNEDLAKEYFTVEMLMERDDVRRFAAWIGKVRGFAR